jgi:sec-independent protein translocase protein TatA
MPCGRIGSTELLLIVLLIVVLFGAKRLPDIGAGLGQGIRGFKKAMKDTDPEDKDKRDERKDV